MFDVSAVQEDDENNDQILLHDSMSSRKTDDYVRNLMIRNMAFNN